MNFSLFSWYEDAHIHQTLANQEIIHFYKIINSIRSVDYLQEPGCDFWKANVFFFLSVLILANELEGQNLHK